MIVVTVSLPILNQMELHLVQNRNNLVQDNYESNGITFGSKLKGKLSPRSYSIQFEGKHESFFLSVPI